MKELLELLRQDATELDLEFRRASIQGQGTPQEVSDFRENSFQSFISRYYPYPFRITKGGIYDSFGLRSDSIDCVICNPVHPHTIDTRGKFRLLLVDGVDIAVEVKPDIASKVELTRGLKQGVSIKQLRRARSPLLLSQNKDPKIVELTAGLLFHFQRFAASVGAISEPVISRYLKNLSVATLSKISL